VGKNWVNEFFLFNKIALERMGWGLSSIDAINGFGGMISGATRVTDSKLMAASKGI